MCPKTLKVKAKVLEMETAPRGQNEHSLAHHLISNTKQRAPTISTAESSPRLESQPYVLSLSSIAKRKNAAGIPGIGAGVANMRLHKQKSQRAKLQETWSSTT